MNTIIKQPRYWVLFDQLLRSATSIGANIVETKAASSRREFIRYFEIALKSANETKYWLLLMLETCEINKVTVLILLEEAKALSNILTASLLTMKNKRNF